MTKMTKMDWFNAIATIIEATDAANKAEALDFIEREKALLDKKRASAKQSKTAKENEGVKETIKTALIEVATAVTITELQNACEELAEYSNQKLSALMNGMVKDGILKKEMVKKKAYFSIAVGD